MQQIYSVERIAYNLSFRHDPVWGRSDYQSNCKYYLGDCRGHSGSKKEPFLTCRSDTVLRNL